MKRPKKLKKKTVLVVAAHPDDEVLGCGATMAWHVSRGDHVHVLILGEGATSRDKSRDRKSRTRELSKLEQAAQAAGGILGVTSVTLHDFPDNRMDSVPMLDVVKVIEDQIDLHRPDVVYTNHPSDLNVDHRVTAQAVVTATRPVPGQGVQGVYFFEVPSSTEWTFGTGVDAFTPNAFVDVTKTIDLKLRALRAYSSEMRAWPHARSYRSVEALARWRGASAGFEAAEAFVVARQLVI